MRQLRTTLVDAQIHTAIHPLLRDESEDVQIQATAVLANICLDFSALKQATLALDIIPTLVSHASSSNTALSDTALAALTNIAYKSCKEVKLRIADCIDPMPLLPKVLGLLRNIPPTPAVVQYILAHPSVQVFNL